jgi:hypothetical protein
MSSRLVRSIFGLEFGVELFQQALEAVEVGWVHRDEFSRAAPRPALGTHHGQNVLVQSKLEWYAVRKSNPRRPAQDRRAIFHRG